MPAKKKASKRLTKKSVDKSEIQSQMDKNLMTLARDMAREHTPDAIDTLASLMNNVRTPPGVRRQCASDLLSQGWGRPEARADDSIKAHGLQINILKLSTGEVETLVGPKMNGSVLDIISEANKQLDETTVFSGTKEIEVVEEVQ